MSHQDIEAFLAHHLPKRTPDPPRLTVTRRPERTRDSLHRLLAAGRLYLKLAQEDLRQ